MAYKSGGISGINKAIKSRTVCTAQLDSGIQISGKFEKKLNDSIDYLQFSGPVQVCYKNKQIKGHGKDRHPQGFGLPIGQLSDGIEIHQINIKKIIELGYKIGKDVVFEFKSGVTVRGILKDFFQEEDSIKIITLEKCEVKYQDQILFDSNWGEYDMVCGTSVESVFGGPADMDSYFEDNKDQIGELNSIVPESNDNQNINSIYSEIRSIRDNKKYDIDRLEKLSFELSNDYPDEWLAKLEIYEILYNQKSNHLKELKESIYSKLNKDPDLLKAIEKSVQLIEK